MDETLPAGARPEAAAAFVEHTRSRRGDEYADSLASLWGTLTVGAPDHSS